MHLEILWDLTRDAFILFILALRFYSRRIYLHIIQSDNSLNFVGAESKLKTALKSLDTKRIEKEVNNNQTKWLFNPPYIPWISETMEALMKVTKRASKTTINEITFTDDTLNTIITEVESIADH